MISLTIGMISLTTIIFRIQHQAFTLYLSRKILSCMISLSLTKPSTGIVLLGMTLSLMLSCSGCKSGKIPETEIIKITADSTQKHVSQNAASAMPKSLSHKHTYIYIIIHLRSQRHNNCVIA